MENQEVNDSNIPKGAGIVTFDMMYRAIHKIQQRVDKIEKEFNDLKSTKTEAKPEVKRNFREPNIMEKKVNK